MEDTDIQYQAGIPLGHKFFAVVLAAAVAAAGCAWLIYRSARSASTAVLAFNPALAQHVYPGIASAKDPAVALADSILDDQSVLNLTKQVHLAPSTPAGRVGEFRSELHLTQPSAQRLDVRFQTANKAQAMAVANDVAHTLAARSSTAVLPNGPSAQPATSAPASAPSQSPAPATQSQSPPPTGGAGSGPSSVSSSPPLPDHALTDALGTLGAQLTAADRKIDGLATQGSSSSGGEQFAYAESKQQSLLRTEVGRAQKTLGDLRTKYPKQVADPKIAGPLDEIQQAIDSILSAGRRSGFNAAGFSTSQINAERSELRQAARIVNRETKKIRLAETTLPGPHAASSRPATSSLAGTTPAASASASTAPKAPAQASASGIQEQNLPASSAGGAPQQPSQDPLRIVRLAAPAPRPPLWPAIAAGAFCGLFYLGIAAFAYRRRGGDDLYSDTNSGPQRMITPADPVRIRDFPAESPEDPPLDRAPRQRAAFRFQPNPPEGADVAAQPEKLAILEADNSEAGEAGEPSEVRGSAGDSVALVDEADSASAPSASMAANEELPSPGQREELLLENRSLVIPPKADAQADPVAERIRRGLAQTSFGRSLEGFDRIGSENPTEEHQNGRSRDWLADWLSPPGE